VRIGNYCAGSIKKYEHKLGFYESTRPEGAVLKIGKQSETKTWTVVYMWAFGWFLIPPIRK